MLPTTSNSKKERQHEELLIKQHLESEAARMKQKQPISHTLHDAKYILGSAMNANKHRFLPESAIKCGCGRQKKIIAKCKDGFVVEKCQCE